MLSVAISHNKMVISYNGKNYKKYSSVESALTKQRLDAVSNALRDKVDALGIDYERIYNVRLTTDIYGGVYVAMDISYGDSMSQNDCLYAAVIPPNAK